MQEPKKLVIAVFLKNLHVAVLPPHPQSTLARVGEQVYFFFFFSLH